MCKNLLALEDSFHYLEEANAQVIHHIALGSVNSGFNQTAQHHAKLLPQ